MCFVIPILKSAKIDPYHKATKLQPLCRIVTATNGETRPSNVVICGIPREQVIQ